MVMFGLSFHTSLAWGTSVLQPEMYIVGNLTSKIAPSCMFMLLTYKFYKEACILVIYYRNDLFNM
jgi:hypothetical protein